MFLRILIFIYCLSYLSLVYTQSGSVTITKVRTLGDGKVDIYVNASKADGGEKWDLTNEIGNFVVKDNIIGGNVNNSKPFYPKLKDVKDSIKQYDASQTQEAVLPDSENVHITILLDVSGSMRDISCRKKEVTNKITTAKKAIRDFLQNSKIPNGAAYLATFGNDLYPTREINVGNVDAILNSIQIRPCPAPGESDEETDLYNSLSKIIASQQDKKGKKIILLVSDGKNDIAKISRYIKSQYKDVISEQSLLEQVSKLEKNTLLYSIALQGSDERFLKSLADATPNPDDKYTPSLQIEELSKVMYDVLKKYTYNFILTYNTKEPGHGEKRNIELYYNDKLMSNKIYSAGGNLITDDTKDLINSKYLLNAFVLGLLIIVVALTLFSVLVPMWRKHVFKRNYVHRYGDIKKGKVTEVDPITDEAFTNDSLVVTKCTRKSLLSTWEHNNDSCPVFPHCLNQQPTCKGEGKEDEKANFFSQNGIYKKLNWLWFGGLGGFIAWILFRVFRLLHAPQLFEKINLMPTPEGKKPEGVLSGWDSLLWDKFTEENYGETTISIVEAGLLGACLGVCVLLALMIVESKVRNGIQIGSTLLKLFLGGMSFFLLFSCSTLFLQYYLFDENLYLTGFIEYLLFGLIMGTLLSIDSSVDIKRGLIAGVVGALISFHLYYFIEFIFRNWGYNISTVISYIIFGFVFGFISEYVIARLESFQLQYLSAGSHTGAINPISKWLLKGLKVMVGKNPGNQVYVKWEDPSVALNHAELYMEGDTIYIKPLEETLVNRTQIPIGKGVPLKHNSVIRLGRTSVSEFLFVETRINKNENTIEERYNMVNSNKEHLNVSKPQIKISKRPN